MSFTRVKIPGTIWLLVTTDDGIDFYYDKATKSSVWEMPEELEDAVAQLKEGGAKRKRLEGEDDDSDEPSKRPKEDEQTEQPGDSTE
jgi:transcription elongation regulator 1